MKIKSHWLLMILVLSAGAVSAQTTSFTYQGNLVNNGTPANGSHDFEFLLFDAVSGGTQIGGAQIRNAVAVSNGLFKADLDFGSQFPGANRFFEVRVRTSGGGGHTILAPRHQIGSSPYAVKSLNAENAATAANATNAATAANALQLGGVAANQYVLTGDTRMADARTPTAGSQSYIQNQSAAPQASTNFNISGTGKAGVLDTASQFNLAGQRILSTGGGGSSLYAGFNAGAPNASTGNSFFGNGAGQNNTGTFNAFFGINAGQANTSASDNSFFGASAGMANTTGTRNSFFGDRAGTVNTIGNDDSYFGYWAGRYATGERNSFFGAGAGQGDTGTTNGTDNSFFGYFAGNDNTSGFFNSFFGAFAGWDNTTGFGNTFLGRNSGGSNVGGANNVFVGDSAGFSANNDSGGSNTGLGYNATISPNITNATAIGSGATATQSNTLILGASVRVGIGTATPKAKLDVTGGHIIVGTPGQGIILKSPNGTVCRILTINDSGTLVTGAIACP